MVNNRLKLHACAAQFRRGVEFYLLEADKVAKSVTVEWEDDPEGCLVEPSFVLGMDNAQELMDYLWHAGLRPTEGSGSAGSLRATEKHLADMRKLVASKLEVEL